MNPRLKTLYWGAIPVLLLSFLATSDHIPGTDVPLTVPYAAEGPGPTFNTLGEVNGEAVIAIEGAKTYPTDGNLNMTTVAVRHNMSLAQALSRWLTTDDTIVPLDAVIPQNKTTDQVDEENKMAFTSSENAATLAAMRYLDHAVVVKVQKVMEGAAADGVLREGDELVAIDGIEVTSAAQVQQLVRKHNPGDVLHLKVRTPNQDASTTDAGSATSGATHDAEVVLGEADGEHGKIAQLGILMAAQPAGDVQVQYNLEDIGGPSAGMMFTLAVIDKLTPAQINGGHFVAGTGTITPEGEVGPIGGIKHKVDAAVEAGAEIFLVPAQNCDELASSAAARKIPMAKVSTLDDAVNALSAFNEGKQFPTCGVSAAAAD